MAKNDYQAILDENKIRPDDLARETGLSRKVLGQVLRQKRTPAPATQARIAKAIQKLTAPAS